MNSSYRSLCRVTATLLVVTAVAGCTTPGPGTSITYAGELDTSSNELRMNGSVFDTSALDKSFSDVTIYFYDSTKTLIASERVGTLDDRLYVSVTVQPVPEYIVIDSPDFWSTDEIAVTYFVREESGNYTGGGKATERSELPVVPER